MSKGIVYVLTGRKHLLPLAVSLFTLRKHYQGDVVLFLDQSDENVDAVLRDARVTTLPVRLNAKSQHATLQFKTELHRYVDFDSFLYMDADTMVCGDPTILIPEEDDHRVVLTQHGDWTTQHDQIGWRLRALREQGMIHPDLIKYLREINAPAINTGVFAMTKRCEIAEVWAQTTLGLDDFWLNLHDEVAMQVLYPYYPHRVYDDRYNCDPRVSLRPADEVVIWHCASRRYGLPPSMDTWFKTIAEVLACNFGDIHFWYTGNPDLVLNHPLGR